jgi:hypothetical protein
MSLKNLIVKGKFYRWVAEGQAETEKVTKEMANITSVITHYFDTIGYYQRTPFSTIYNYKNFEFELVNLYCPPNDPSPPKRGFFSRKKIKKEPTYFEKLETLKPGAPSRINVNTNPGIFKNQTVIFVEIISEPAIIQQYQQCHIRTTLNDDDIDLIIYENEQAIEKFGKACLLKIIEEPTPFGSLYKTQITEKLNVFGFKEISSLLENGREDIEKGHTEDGLVDLRTALERFFMIIVELKGEKPAPQKDVNKNIDKLRGLGYIDEYTHQLLLKLCYNGLYTTVSQVTHDRISRDYFDSRFQYNIAEQSFDYVLERVIKLNLSSIPKKKE